ncbi:hypothetical protein EDD85DRAFT_946121 [Armillaria nabsnona]|nr:hypothetical protein EDD85DRAFT_946121 [Armillaria nabsnona]
MSIENPDWIRRFVNLTAVSPPKQIRNTFLRTVIITLYVLRTVTFAMDWGFKHRAFIEHGHNHCSVFIALLDDGKWGRAIYFITNIASGISILLVDATIIWRCWVLWVCRWKIVLLPGVCTIAGTGESLNCLRVYLSLTISAMKIMQILSDSLHNSVKTGVLAATIDWPLIYLLLTLTTTVMCTLLIVYRIVRFAHRLLFFRSIISALIESSAIYTLALIGFLMVQKRNLMAANYADIMLAYIRAIAPTLLILRVAATSNSTSDDKESNMSTNISDIDFRPMEENPGSDNLSEQRFSACHGMHATETV